MELEGGFIAISRFGKQGREGELIGATCWSPLVIAISGVFGVSRYSRSSA
ncbi:MAG: hypothetical protein ACRDDA_04375 [Aeromonas sp.]